MQTATELAKMLAEDQTRFNAARLALERAIDDSRRAYWLWKTLDDGGESLANALQEVAER